MKRKVVQRRQGEQDLLSLARFIQRDNPDAADRLLLAFDETIKSIVELPEMGRPWETTKPRLVGLRWWAIRDFPNHLIFYRLLADRILILRVVYGSCDLHSLFG